MNCSQHMYNLNNKFLWIKNQTKLRRQNAMPRNKNVKKTKSNKNHKFLLDTIYFNNIHFAWLRKFYKIPITYTLYFLGF